MSARRSKHKRDDGTRRADTGRKDTRDKCGPQSPKTKRRASPANRGSPRSSGRGKGTTGSRPTWSASTKARSPRKAPTTTRARKIDRIKRGKAVNWPFRDDEGRFRHPRKGTVITKTQAKRERTRTLREGVIKQIMRANPDMRRRDAVNSIKGIRTSAFYRKIRDIPRGKRETKKRRDSRDARALLRGLGVLGVVREPDTP